MNFHISPLSPLRPRLSTSLSPGPSSSSSASAGAARPPRRPEQHQQLSPPKGDDDDHDGTDRARTAGLPGHPTIEVEAAEADEDGNDNNERAARRRRDSSSDSSEDDSSGSDSDASADDVTQDSRDVLVQRLNDLAQRLGAASNVRSENVEALHAQVDQMERVLTSKGANRSGSRSRRASRSTSRHSSSAAALRRQSGASLQPGPRPRSMGLPGGGSSGGGGGGGGDALGLMAPLSPSWLMSRFQQRLSIHREVDGRASGGEDDQTSERRKGPAPAPMLLPPTNPVPSSSVEQPDPAGAGADDVDDSPQMSYEMADRIVQEAEGLCAEMASVIQSLQKRREESDHLHSVLIQREIAADKLILEQANRISELEDTVAEDESELRYLKIQLRGIEAQCMGYIPQGADPELDRSIRSWKNDWSALRDRWSSRRGTSFVSGDESSTFSNPTSPSVQ